MVRSLAISLANIINNGIYNNYSADTRRRIEVLLKIRSKRSHQYNESICQNGTRRSDPRDR